MKTLKYFNDESEAHLAKDLLAANEIACEILGAKDYAAHVVGGTGGRYELLVNWADLVEGQRILAGVETQAPPEDQRLKPDYFRRAAFYAIAAAVLGPVIFNAVSLLNANYFWRDSLRDKLAWFKLALILLLQLPGLALAALLLKMIFARE